MGTTCAAFDGLCSLLTEIGNNQLDSRFVVDGVAALVVVKLVVIDILRVTLQWYAGGYGVDVSKVPAQAIVCSIQSKAGTEYLFPVRYLGVLFPLRKLLKVESEEAFVHFRLCIFNCYVSLYRVHCLDLLSPQTRFSADLRALVWLCVQSYTVHKCARDFVKFAATLRRQLAGMCRDGLRQFPKRCAALYAVFGVVTH